MSELAGIAVAFLLEDDEDEYFDIKDDIINVPERAPFFEQIDGDYGDAWVYGGSWYNPMTREIVHHDGIEHTKDYESWDMEVPDHVMAKINRIEDERERDNVIDRLKDEMARVKNEKRKFRVYRFYAPDNGKLEPWMEKKVPRVAETVGMSIEDFLEMPLPNQILEIGRYSGMDNFDGSPDQFTRRELSSYLEIEL